MEESIRFGLASMTERRETGSRRTASNDLAWFGQERELASPPSAPPAWLHAHVARRWQQRGSTDTAATAVRIARPRRQLG